MTLGILLLYVGIAAILLTLITYFGLSKKESIGMSYLQNFCGALFVFSGWVKAVDPLGTAYKMEDYFEQFEYVFEGTWFSFLAPIFPVVSDFSIAFSVFMIVFEIVLGVMLILGHKPKLTAWSFILLVGFFTILTGFTYLTGYVPGDIKFFNFSSWAEYDANNMKVTDCGCFGDFIKLEPKISFFKDVFLMIPAIFFIFRSSTMHTLFTRTVRNLILSIVGLGLIYLCLSNYVWDIPENDFRPFKKGVNIAAQKKLEEDAMANVQILAYKVTNMETKESKEIPYADYMKTYQSYPSSEWELEQISTEPEIEHSKISEFDVTDQDGYLMNDEILASDGPLLFIVAHELLGDGSPSTRVVKDTLYKVDSIYQRDGSLNLVKSISTVNERTEQYIDYSWKEFYAKRYIDVVVPFINKARVDGIPVVLVAGADFEQMHDLRNDLKIDARFGTADDLLLKTIVRSNPGIVLMNSGLLVDKWHYKKLPSYDSVKENYLQ